MHAVLQAINIYWKTYLQSNQLTPLKKNFKISETNTLSSENNLSIA